MDISEDFAEEFWLRDGRAVGFRLVRPTDKPAFVRGLKLCSDETLYNRFMGAKPRFSDAELTYLTECDGWDHIAVVGFHEVDMVAVGRAIRYKSRPEAADFGVIVADSFQKNGIGSFVLGLLMKAAAERGIVFLCGEMFSTNSAMFRVVDDLPFQTTWILDGSVASFEIDLSSPKSG